MKRSSSIGKRGKLPTFGDYRRMRTPTPFYERVDKQQEILRNAAEDQKAAHPQPPTFTAETDRR